MDAKDLIVIARKRAGISQRELAERLGRPQATIARWEAGAREPHTRLSNRPFVLAGCSS
jgi:transcriptional regulator with XRE-family HTH domain